MDSLFLFIFEVICERVDDMKEIVEQPMSPAGRESHDYILDKSSESKYNVGIGESL